MFDIAALNKFYSSVSSTDGISIRDLQEALHSLFAQGRSEKDVDDFRLSKGSWKKLKDEVIPVSFFLELQKIVEGRVRFPLDNRPPDCWLWGPSSNSPVGIEVTIAQARERYHLETEFVTTGFGRMFIGVSDDSPQQQFDAEMSKQPAMYSTDQILSAMRAGIDRCMRRKHAPKFSGMILLIQAPMFPPPRERWDAIVDDLRATALPLPFAEVHVIGSRGESPWGFQIK